MQKVRKLVKRDLDGTHFTYAEALATWREVKKEREALAKKKAESRRKSTAKAR